MKIGYACINATLNKQKILTGRAIRESTLKEQGLYKVYELALQNSRDLLTILRWNLANNIYLFRLGSDIIPWGNKVNLSEIPNFSQIQDCLLRAGKFATENSMRITTHPGPFNLLASPKEDVVINTIKDLEHHAEIFDFMGLSRTVYNKINIHVGATYGDKVSAADTWCRNFDRLSPAVKSRLTIENDDKESMFSVLYLYELIHSRTGIPIVFDYHHHKFCTGGLSEQEALELAISTWPEGITPTVHYSESKSVHENDSSINPRAHSDFVNGPISMYGHDLDIMFEAKAKELAVLKARSNIGFFLP